MTAPDVETRAGGYAKLDSYSPSKGEIVSRKFTQLAEISERSAIAYVREAATKYAPGTRIAKVPSSGALGGEQLSGTLYLEIPIQNKLIPKRILDSAARYGVKFRDVNGKVY